MMMRIFMISPHQLPAPHTDRNSQHISTTSPTLGFNIETMQYKE